MARLKSEGQSIVRPKVSLSKQTKLIGKDDTIKELWDKKVAVSTIGRKLGVNRLTVENYIKSRNIRVSVKI